MAKVKKFGTFGGVFTPSILTILGVIMYMRFPTILGQLGITKYPCHNRYCTYNLFHNQFKCGIAFNRQTGKNRWNLFYDFPKPGFAHRRNFGGCTFYRFIF